MKGGLPVAEITFRTPAAEAAIRALAKRGDLLVGAGTVLTTEQADRAIDAGAQFIVAPGTNPKVVEHVLKRGVPMVPGVATPSEIELAMSLGVDGAEILPGRNDGRRRDAQGVRRAVSGRAIHSDRRNHAGAVAELFAIADRRRLRRLVDGAARVVDGRPVRCDRVPGRTGGQSCLPVRPTSRLS